MQALEEAQVDAEARAAAQLAVLSPLHRDCAPLAWVGAGVHVGEIAYMTECPCSPAFVLSR